MATFVNEDFAGTDGVTVQANDAQWTKHSSATGDALISTNRARANGAVQAIYYHSGTPASADYSVEAVIRRDTGVTSTEIGGVAGRMDTSVNTKYDFVRVETGSFILRKTVAGTDTNLDTHTLALATPVEYTIRLEMVGTTIKGYVDGVEVCSATDSSVTAAGKAGFFLFRGGSAAAYHLDSITATDIGSAPANTVAPAVTGVAETGQTLTCSTGTWTGDPTITYAYQWKRAGSSIGGATSSTYLLQVADEGVLVRCDVTATNGIGSATAQSNAVTPDPASPADPTCFIKWDDALVECVARVKFAGLLYPPLGSATEYVSVGTHASFRFYGTEADINTAMDTLRAEGYTAIRDDCQWSTVEPASSGGFTGWAATDRWMKQAAENGFDRVYVPLTKTPSWATTGGSDAAAPITTEATLHGQYQAFVAAVITRYNSVNGTFWAGGGGGAGLSPPEFYPEIWNEPWGSWAWRNASDGTARTPSGSEYANMCKSVVQSLVTAGKTTGYTLLWHTNVTQSPGTNFYHDDMWTAVTDLDDYCAGWSVHTYPEFDGTNPTSDPDTDAGLGANAAASFATHAKYEFKGKYKIIRQLDTAKGATIPIHMTEVGWPTEFPALSASSANRVVTTANQAAHYTSIFTILAADSPKIVEGLVLYSWKDTTDAASATSREQSFGVRLSSGTAKTANTNVVSGIATGIEAP
jgi:hypothetical protein